jgi:hypothetical protein
VSGRPFYRSGSRLRAESIGLTVPGLVVRLATSSNAAARSYSPASTASLIASLIASSLVVGGGSERSLTG